MHENDLNKQTVNKQSCPSWIFCIDCCRYENLDQARSDLPDFFVSRDEDDGNAVTGCVKAKAEDGVSFVGPLAVNPKYQVMLFNAVVSMK